MNLYCVCYCCLCCRKKNKLAFPYFFNFCTSTCLTYLICWIPYHTDIELLQTHYKTMTYQSIEMENSALFKIIFEYANWTNSKKDLINQLIDYYIVNPYTSLRQIHSLALSLRYSVVSNALTLIVLKEAIADLQELLELNYGQSELYYLNNNSDINKTQNVLTFFTTLNKIVHHF